MRPLLGNNSNWSLWHGLVALFCAAVLVATAGRQIFDTNFYSTWEAASLLAGDHPYRDFYEWGIPLQAVVSAIAQWLVGYRLIGELAIHWVFIIIGAVVAFDLGVRLSGSVAASLCAALAAAFLLTTTPSFHYPKLFFYPVAIWLSWWYLERPSVVRSVALGVLTATAFLFRHDHGVYIAGLAALTLVLARLAVPASRTVRSMFQHGAACAGTAALLVAPWALLVHASEGLPEYVDSRADLYREWSAQASPYSHLRRFDPVAMVTRVDPPPPTPGIVRFEWQPELDTARRLEIEREFGLELLEEGGADRRWRYQLPDVYDVRLLELNRRINNTEGFDWGRLMALQSRLPTQEETLLWHAQIAMLVPILLIASALFNAWRHWRAGRPPGADLYRILAAAPWLAVVEWRLLRELSYAELVFPVVAAMSARLIVGPPRDDRDARRQRSAGTVVATARWAIAGALALITAVSIVAHTRHTEIFSLSEIPNSVGLAFHQLIVSPPIEGLLPAATVKAYTRAQWDAGRLDWGRVAVRYMHDCSVAGDRILVTGSTPYHIAYYVNRTIAGGHLFWRHSWRSDPMRERLSLDLIQRQSVPFVLSINDPALTDFARYPAIHRHLASHYVALDGTGGHVLIDARRQPTGTYEQLGFPCFR